ncbi:MULTISPECIES: selenocysteine-specific translation elongation factor [Brevibacterium]|uniref:Selenocysteine-specific elongation factor n=1 Tax=Brevibacterium antiquum CNRZ 918 TaxID=1255637 RepID=A0A2H1I637_9MICO|nr:MULTISPECIES: selenocysteine-specific translation elongation factor [Brevibacterium]SMX70584.1 selenocysteine-specific translation elongation factor SelB [Brevibacterium antiquum CNRZ 918]HCG55131.1 selenocysteine-specific translation elongation factor [Brevibacterium sp.]
MYVVATAGHVDHGKSTLVSALTGMEPDRWAEEKKRGLTIDLGFAWTTLPSGRELAFVDVPGHEKFLANMLAGVGPAPIVCLVVAADKGWQAQSSDHRDAITALGITRGLVVITRADIAPEALAATEAEARVQLQGTPLANAPVVTVSATSGEGLEELVATLDAVTADTPAPDPGARLRLWVDRAFTIKGAGTVVTGTLTAGTLRTGDRLRLVGETSTEATGVRGLQSRNSAAGVVVPSARVAVNLRDVGADVIHRGDALITDDAWPVVEVIDVRRTMGQPLDEGAHGLMLHIGTAAVPVHMRPFDGDHARLTLDRGLPLQVTDRIVLRSPGSRNVFAGVVVIDVDPPELGRRGAGARRASELADRPETGDILAEVARRGAVERARLLRFGLSVPEVLPDDVADASGGWLIHRPTLEHWVEAARTIVKVKLAAEPLAAGVPEKALAEELRRVDPPLPGETNRELVAAIASRAGLETVKGMVRPPGHSADLGPAEAGVAEVERRLAANPFAAPEADDLRELRLGVRELAVAESAGRLLRLGDGVVVSPRTPAQAMRLLAGLDQPFTTSAARQALGTTRRVVIPLLEYLDGRGWTRRIDNTSREVVR